MSFRIVIEGQRDSNITVNSCGDSGKWQVSANHWLETLQLSSALSALYDLRNISNNLTKMKNA